jgi:hypothetical protein
MVRFGCGVAPTWPRHRLADVVRSDLRTRGHDHIQALTCVTKTRPPSTVLDIPGHPRPNIDRPANTTDESVAGVVSSDRAGSPPARKIRSARPCGPPRFAQMNLSMRRDLAARGLAIGRSPVDSGHVRFVVTFARGGREVIQTVELFLAEHDAVGSGVLLDSGNPPGGGDWCDVVAPGRAARPARSAPGWRRPRRQSPRPRRRFVGCAGSSRRRSAGWSCASRRRGCPRRCGSAR